MDVHLDRFARQSERRHADQHRSAAVGQAVVDIDAVALHGELAGHGDAGRAGADDRDALRPSLDVGHDVRNPGGLMPLDEEPLHRPDRERPVDVAAAAGPLARSRADVRAHRRDRVRLAGQDVALLEAALGREVQVAAAVRADRAGFLAFDVALEPGGVDGLDEEFRVDVECQGVVVFLRQAGDCRTERRTDAASAGTLESTTRPVLAAKREPFGSLPTAAAATG